MRKIFLEAAERIDSGKSAYSCNALNVAGGYTKRSRELVRNYSFIISPNDYRSVMINDFELTSQGNYRQPSEYRAHRVIALLMVGAAWNDLRGEPWKEK